MKIVPLAIASLAAAAAVIAQAHAVIAQAQMPRPSSMPGNPAVAQADDARRAAALRLLDASRFRERQAVSIGDTLKAVQADLAEECLTRAMAGRDLGNCRALTAPNASGASLASVQSGVLDQVMTASQTIYARHFSAAEMDEITRFFRTPVGQRYAAIYPQLITEVAARRRDILRRYVAPSAGGKP